MKNVEIDVLKGQTISKIVGGVGDDKLVLETTGGKKYTMFHSQDCCESVWLEDIVGDLDDIIGSQILDAREDTNSDNILPDRSDDSFTWTFYIVSTIKGTITLRWYGTSNGYYSEDVEIVESDND